MIRYKNLFALLFGYFLLIILVGCSSKNIAVPTNISIPVVTNTEKPSPTTMAITFTLTSPSPTLTPYPKGDGKLIAFTSQIINETDYDVQEGYISIVNFEDHTTMRLTSKDIIARDAAWSPDGSRIAYNVPTNQGNEMLYVMDANGDNNIFLDIHCFSPEWSPNANFITCTSHSLGKGYGIYIINAKQRTKQRISEEVWGSASWSKDSKRIAYDTYNFLTNESSNIFIKNMDDNLEPIQITSGQSQNTTPKWSPDGKHIMFVSSRTGTEQIYVVNVDGSEEHALTTNNEPNFDAAWSPDGTKIVFVSLRHENNLSKCPYLMNPCNSEIYVMNADGSQQTRLTNSPGEDSKPVWSPDGKYIAFVSFHDEPNLNSCEWNCNSEIYIISVDHKNIIRLTNNTTSDLFPVWQPNP